jgi:RNA polymerase sigma-70 factor (ECF subfamily)
MGFSAPAPAPEEPTQAVPLDVAGLYAEHGAFIGRVIQRLVGSGPHVDDLVQETFIVAFRKRATFDGRAAARTWLYGIAANLSMRHRRGMRRFGLFQDRLAREVSATDEDVPDRQLERQLERRRHVAIVHEVLSRLPFKQREVFVLYELEGLDGAQISELLGVPLGTVWTRLRVARQSFEPAMRKRIAKEHQS